MDDTIIFGKSYINDINEYEHIECEYDCDEYDYDDFNVLVYVNRNAKAIKIPSFVKKKILHLTLFQTQKSKVLLFHIR